jgi:hypothetical protein
VNFLIIARHGNDGPNQKLPETHIFQGFQRVNLYPYIIAIVDVIAAISPDVAPKMAASRWPSLNLPIHLHMLQIYLHFVVIPCELLKLSGGIQVSGQHANVDKIVAIFVLSFHINESAVLQLFHVLGNGGLGIFKSFHQVPGAHRFPSGVAIHNVTKQPYSGRVSQRIGNGGNQFHFFLHQFIDFLS